MEQRTSLTEIIEHINPSELTYQEWCSVGMALKQEGYPVSVWDAWSQKDYGRYHTNECEKKENLFRLILTGNRRHDRTACPGSWMGSGEGP